MKLGVIGCGKMGTALVKGAVKAGAVEGKNVFLFDHKPATAGFLAKELGGKSVGSLEELLEQAEALLLCTKPKDVPKVLAEMARCKESKLVISVAAGVTLQALQAPLPVQFRVVRSMPNTPSLVGQGATAYTADGEATDADIAFTQKLFSSVGIAMEVPENLLDAVTGLSGSGPAYIYLAIEALADGGVRNGLPRETAIQLAAQTVLGAATMVLQTGTHPAVLKDQVTSPGGTTIAGLATLEQNGMRSALIEAVTAATTRSRELGKS